jgi:hypothetical protein
MIPTLRRIPKELLPLFLCVSSRDCRKTSYEMVNSDHIEARMRYCILHRLYPASRFDRDDIIVIKSGQDFSRNKTHIVRRRQYIERNNTGKLPVAVISERRLCFYSVQSGMKSGVLRKLLMCKVELLVQTDT